MHPELLSMSLFMFVTSCSPGPNNIVASYSGFNFGLIKTIPHMCGVIFGFTTLVIVVNFGLISVFKNFPIIQEIIKYGGTIWVINPGSAGQIRNYGAARCLTLTIEDQDEWTIQPHIYDDIFS